MSNEIKTNVTVYLPVPLVRKLNDAARLNACSRSEFVQRIIDKYIKDEKRKESRKEARKKKIMEKINEKDESK